MGNCQSNSSVNQGHRNPRLNKKYNRFNGEVDGRMGATVLLSETPTNANRILTYDSKKIEDETTKAMKEKLESFEETESDSVQSRDELQGPGKWNDDMVDFSKNSFPKEQHVEEYQTSEMPDLVPSVPPSNAKRSYKQGKKKNKNEWDHFDDQSKAMNASTPLESDIEGGSFFAANSNFDSTYEPSVTSNLGSTLEDTYLQNHTVIVWDDNLDEFDQFVGTARTENKLTPVSEKKATKFSHMQGISETVLNNKMYKFPKVEDDRVKPTEDDASLADSFDASESSSSSSSMKKEANSIFSDSSVDNTQRTKGIDNQALIVSPNPTEYVGLRELRRMDESNMSVRSNLSVTASNEVEQMLMNEAQPKYCEEELLGVKQADVSHSIPPPKETNLEKMVSDPGVLNLGSCVPPPPPPPPPPPRKMHINKSAKVERDSEKTPVEVNQYGVFMPEVKTRDTLLTQKSQHKMYLSPPSSFEEDEEDDEEDDKENEIDVHGMMQQNEKKTSSLVNKVKETYPQIKNVPIDLKSKQNTISASLVQSLASTSQSSPKDNSVDGFEFEPSKLGEPQDTESLDAINGYHHQPSQQVFKPIPGERSQGADQRLNKQGVSLTGYRRRSLSPSIHRLKKNSSVESNSEVRDSREKISAFSVSQNGRGQGLDVSRSSMKFASIQQKNIPSQDNISKVPRVECDIPKDICSQNPTYTKKSLTGYQRRSLSPSPYRKNKPSVMKETNDINPNKSENYHGNNTKSKSQVVVSSQDYPGLIDQSKSPCTDLPVCTSAVKTEIEPQNISTTSSPFVRKSQEIQTRYRRRGTSSSPCRYRSESHSTRTECSSNEIEATHGDEKKQVVAINSDKNSRSQAEDKGKVDAKSNSDNKCIDKNNEKKTESLTCWSPPVVHRRRSRSRTQVIDDKNDNLSCETENTSTQELGDTTMRHTGYRLRSRSPQLRRKNANTLVSTKEMLSTTDRNFQHKSTGTSHDADSVSLYSSCSESSVANKAEVMIQRLKSHRENFGKGRDNFHIGSSTQGQQSIIDGKIAENFDSSSIMSVSVKADEAISRIRAFESKPTRSRYKSPDIELNGPSRENGSSHIDNEEKRNSFRSRDGYYTRKNRLNRITA